MKTRVTGLPYMPSLDGLRGLAVAGVLFFHGGHLVGGYLGVDLFFVLSGFLITSLLLAECRSDGKIVLGTFWLRRAKRLLPALVMVLTAVLLYAAFVAQPTELHRIRYDALATVSYVANWRQIFAHQDYWSLFTSPSPLQHTWSLAIEEQFYLVWPLILALVVFRAKRLRNVARTAQLEMKSVARLVLILSTSLAVASGLLAIVLDHLAGASRVYYGTDTRAAGILIGAALAALLALRGPVKTRRGRVALELVAMAAAALLVTAWFRLDGSSALLYHGGLFVCSLAAAGVIAAAAHPEPGLMARALRFRPLALLGVISYGVYLWHWPIFVWFDGQRSGLGGWSLFAAQVTLTLAVAIASFVLIERPIRRGRISIRHFTPVVPATAVALVFGIVLSTAATAPPEGSAAASRVRGAVLADVHSAPASSPRLLVVGNSVAFFLATQGFDQVRSHPKVAVINGALPDCNFPDSRELRTEGASPTVVGSVPCATKWGWDVQQSKPQVVLFTEAGILGEQQHDGHWLRPCSPAYDQWFLSSLESAARIFRSDGARLAIATSAYPDYVFIDRSLWRETDCVNNIERAMAAHDSNVSLVDLGKYVCPTKRYCRQSIHGVPMRPDGVHFLGRSAEAIASWMLPRLPLSAGDGRPVRLVAPKAT